MQNNTQNSWEEALDKLSLKTQEENWTCDAGCGVDKDKIKSFIHALLQKQAEEISEKYLQALKEPEEWCLQHYGYATKEQEEEIYKEGMDAMRAYKTIRFLAIKQVINK